MPGWRLDADASGDEYRLVQFTPPGSACSIQFGSNLTPGPPGSAHGLLLNVADVEAARQDLAWPRRRKHCARAEIPARTTNEGRWLVIG